MKYEYKCLSCGAKLSYSAHLFDPIVDYFNCPVCKQDKMERLANRHLTSHSSRAAGVCERLGHLYYWKDGICIVCGAVKPPPA